MNAGGGGYPVGGGGYPIPARVARAEEVIQRSRFLTLVAHAPTSEAAHHFLQTTREAHPDATHHCWAFVAGPPGSTASVGLGDDGEPHGTAGRPMLTALLHSGIGEIVAVCVRWYGGTKLGTGGLSRAYAGGVKAALEDLEVESRIERGRAEVQVGYAHVDGLQRLLDDVDAVQVEERYGVDVTYVVEIPETRWVTFERGLADLTQGVGRLRRI